MILQEITNEFKSFLPLFTDMFTTNIDISSVTKVGDTVTIVTSTAHGLTVGRQVTLTGIENTIPISSLTRSGNVATAVTSSDTDLTEGFFPTIKVSGADQADYNGTFELKNVIDRTTFTYKVQNLPTTPATGTIKYHDKLNLGFNGEYEVITAPDSTTFTVTNSDPILVEGSGSGMQLKLGIRISAAANIERVLSVYTKKSFEELWGFIVPLGAVIDKDRKMDNDAVSIRTTNTNYQQRRIKNFAFYVFIPTKLEIGGRTAADIADDLIPSLYKSILGYRVASPFVSSPYSIITPIGDNLFTYNTAFYVHEYTFQFYSFNHSFLLLLKI